MLTREILRHKIIIVNNEKEIKLMNKIISLTVDTDDYNALTRASDMLHGMAQDVKNDRP